MDSIANFVLKVSQGESNQQYVYCNTSIHSTTTAKCFDLLFPSSGSYQVDIIPNMDYSQQLKSGLKLNVESLLYLVSMTPT